MYIWEKYINRQKYHAMSHTHLQQCLLTFQQSTSFKVSPGEIEQHISVVKVVKLAQAVFILQMNVCMHNCNAILLQAHNWGGGGGGGGS